MTQKGSCSRAYSPPIRAIFSETIISNLVLELKLAPLPPDTDEFRGGRRECGNLAVVR